MTGRLSRPIGRYERIIPMLAWAWIVLVIGGYLLQFRPVLSNIVEALWRL